MDLAARIAGHLDVRLQQQPRLLVAVDGPDAAGKTTLGDDVAAALPDRTVRATVDGFHRPAAERHARGALSPEGYCADSFDLLGLAGLLRRFASGATEVTTAVFDHRADVPRVVTVEAPRQAAVVDTGDPARPGILRDTLGIVSDAPG